jgi:Uma2 family endonuclease
MATGTLPVSGGSPSVRPFTRAEYHRLGALGLIGPDERTELIEGVIYRMAPEGPGHNELARRLLFALGRLNRPGVAQLSTASLVVGDSEVVPDATLLRWRDDFYRGRLPTAPDALLVVEISHSTLAFEYWILDVAARVLRVYAAPEPDGYVAERVLSEGEIAPQELPDQTVAVVDLFGPAP